MPSGDLNLGEFDIRKLEQSSPSLSFNICCYNPLQRLLLLSV